jgi:hypothetical protein
MKPVVIGLPFALAVSVIALPASRSDSALPLDLEARVAAQRAIEEIYWKNRIWPATNPQRKPHLAALLSDVQLRAKVVDSLRMSAALEANWGRPVTGEQLQAELDRMAADTKSPETLNQLFNALGRDPAVIAECLVRPVLVRRLARNLFARDERIHGDLRRQAERDLARSGTVAGMASMGGEYSEVEFGLRGEVDRAPSTSWEGNPSVILDRHEWGRLMGDLAETFGAAGALDGERALPPVRASGGQRSLLRQRRAPRAPGQNPRGLSDLEEACLRELVGRGEDDSAGRTQGSVLRLSPADRLAGRLRHG